MIKNLKKLVTCICIVLVLFNFMLHTATFAKDVDDIKSNYKDSFTSSEDKLAAVLSGIAGVLTWIPRAMIIAGASIIQIIGSSAANIVGETDAGAKAADITLSPDDVIFNKINLTSIDFFNYSRNVRWKCYIRN